MYSLMELSSASFLVEHLLTGRLWNRFNTFTTVPLSSAA
jgi:hypothetical protein